MISVISVVGMALVLFCVSAAEKNVSDIYKNYHIYDIYKEKEVNLAKQAVCDYIPGMSIPYYVLVDEDIWNEKFVTYMEKAIRDSNFDEAMEKIACESRTLTFQEKQQMRQEHPELEKYYGADTWYEADLTQTGGDLVMCKKTWDGYNISFIVSHMGGTDSYSNNPLFAGGQKNCEPYFIQWDNNHYVVYPYWDDKNEKIYAMAIYDLNSDNKIHELSIGLGSYFPYCEYSHEVWMIQPGGIRWPEKDSKAYIPYIHAYTPMEECYETEY